MIETEKLYNDSNIKNKSILKTKVRVAGPQAYSKTTIQCSLYYI